MPIQEVTRLSVLRAEQPEAGAVLDTLLPALRQLQNPVLRKTVEENLTVAKAAEMAGLSTPTLLRQLRAVTGQTSEPVTESGEPPWLSEDRIACVIDAGAMLQTGEHPIGRVRQAAADLAPGGIVKILVPFRPAPLLDTLARAGYSVFCRQVESSFEVFIARA